MEGGPPHPHPPPSEPTDIVGEDEQLYDWGIENRLDQYYQNAAAAAGGGGAATAAAAAASTTAAAAYTPPASEPGYSNPGLQQQQHAHYDGRVPDQYVDMRLTPPPTPQQQHSFPRAAQAVEPEAKPQQQQHTSYPGYSDPSLQTEIRSSPRPLYRSGRRPSLPQVDMDANEAMKVKLILPTMRRYFYAMDDVQHVRHLTGLKH